MGTDLYPWSEHLSQPRIASRLVSDQTKELVQDEMANVLAQESHGEERKVKRVLGGQRNGQYPIEPQLAKKC